MPLEPHDETISQWLAAMRRRGDTVVTVSFFDHETVLVTERPDIPDCVVTIPKGELECSTERRTRG